jgi:Alginate lyase
MALMRLAFVFVWLGLSLAGPTFAEGLLPISAELQAKPKLWAKLKRKCDSEITVAARPVAVLAPHPHYSADGTNAKDPDAEALAQDSRMAYRAGLCYALSKDEAYALHVQRIVDAWAFKLTSVPNAQGVADVNFNVPKFVFAASFAADAGHWDQGPFKAFLTKTISPLSRADRPNNHGNWGVLLNASIAVYVGDDAALKKSVARWRELIAQQVAADGSMPLEMCRSDSKDHCGGPHKGINGLSYTHFTLLPSALAAEIFLKKGQNVYQSPEAVKLGLAFLRAAHWTLNPESFPYYASNRGALNGVTNCAYFATLIKHFNNVEAASILDKSICQKDQFLLTLIYSL